MELCALLAPVAGIMLQHREPRMLEEATRALRWLLIEPEDPSQPAPPGGVGHMLPSKVLIDRASLLLASLSSRLLLFGL